MKPSELGYTLKKPCADCPFRKDAKFHEGVLADLPGQVVQMGAEEFAHTCHKTDPRSDSEEGKRYKGQTQHCAGALLMMKKKAIPVGKVQMAAILKGKWEPSKMPIEAENLVFDSLKDMAKHYVDGFAATGGKV